MSLWLLGRRGEERGEGTVRESGIDTYTLLYLKWIRVRREERGVQDGGTHICGRFMLAAMWRKPPQYCKVIILQLNKL